MKLPQSSFFWFGSGSVSLILAFVLIAPKFAGAGNVVFVIIVNYVAAGIIKADGFGYAFPVIKQTYRNRPCSMLTFFYFVSHGVDFGGGLWFFRIYLQ